jgi:hypothetical protein
MHELFASGLVVDLAIGLLMLEALVLAWQRGRRSTPALPTVVAGLGLMLGWRFTQAGWDWTWIAAALSLAGLAHGWDLRRLWHQTR